MKFLKMHLTPKNVILSVQNYRKKVINKLKFLQNLTEADLLHYSRFSEYTLRDVGSESFAPRRMVSDCRAEARDLHSEFRIPNSELKILQFAQGKL